MKKAGIMAAAVGGVLVTLAAIAGCGRDIGGSATGVTGAGSPLIDGSRIRGTLVETVSTLASAPAYLPEPARRDFSAVVEHGEARLDGAIIAHGRGLPRATSDVEFTDREGRRARLVAHAGAPGQALRGFQVYRDGQLLVDVAFRWQNLNGAWLLGERTLTVYDHGRAVLTHTRALDGASLASAGLRLPSLGGTGSLAAFLLPQRLEASSCFGEAAMTVLAASAVGAAAAGFIAAPSPATYLVLAGAIAVYDGAMDVYVACLDRQLLDV
ncbi:MAG: hypothetical protein AABY85_06720 [Gemmatimonadota bacterium]|jgi:hypothetical protein